MLIDLHAHTRVHSWDSDLTPDELVEAAKRSGLDGICLTEHDFFWDAQEVRGLARRHDFLVLPGVEINTDNGHMLCFGLRSYVYGMHRVEELAGHVARASGAMIAAHPHRRQMPWHDGKESYEAALASAAANPAYAAIAAVERINGRASERENAFAADLTDLLGLPSTAGSDSHVATDVGLCATEFLDRVEDLEGLISALRSGRCRAVTLRANGNAVRGRGSIQDEP
jgi:predicted metal-dependent phosphoesterase TrpH